MNSLRSALTAVLAGLPNPQMQAKGDPEARFSAALSARVILSVGLVQNIGQVTNNDPLSPSVACDVPGLGRAGLLGTVNGNNSILAGGPPNGIGK